MAENTQQTTHSKGGRPKADPAKARCHRIQLYLTQEEHEQLLSDYAQSGHTSLSAYVVKKLSGKKQSTLNPILFLEQMDNIGKDIHRIGHHIHQIARYTQTLADQEKIDPTILSQFHEHMKAYHRARLKLVNAYRAVVKSFR